MWRRFLRMMTPSPNNEPEPRRPPVPPPAKLGKHTVSRFYPQPHPGPEPTVHPSAAKKEASVSRDRRNGTAGHCRSVYEVWTGGPSRSGDKVSGNTGLRMEAQRRQEEGDPRGKRDSKDRGALHMGDLCMRPTTRIPLLSRCIS